MWVGKYHHSFQSSKPSSLAASLTSDRDEEVLWKDLGNEQMRRAMDTAWSAATRARQKHLVDVVRLRFRSWRRSLGYSPSAYAGVAHLPPLLTNISILTGTRDSHWTLPGERRLRRVSANQPGSCCEPLDVMVSCKRFRRRTLRRAAMRPKTLFFMLYYTSM